jgi:tetratricopeptide (TPR) repeat protein
VGDRAGGGGEYGKLGNAYGSLGDFSQSIEYYTQHLVIAKEMGNRAGEGTAYANLGTCHMHLNEYDKAVAYFEAFEAQHDIGNIAEACAYPVPRSAEHGCRPRPSRPGSSPGPCCYWC